MAVTGVPHLGGGRPAPWVRHKSLVDRSISYGSATKVRRRTVSCRLVRILPVQRRDRVASRSAAYRIIRSGSFQICSTVRGRGWSSLPAGGRTAVICPWRHVLPGVLGRPGDRIGGWRFPEASCRRSRTTRRRAGRKLLTMRRGEGEGSSRSLGGKTVTLLNDGHRRRLGVCVDYAQKPRPAITEPHRR